MFPEQFGRSEAVTFILGDLDEFLQLRQGFLGALEVSHTSIDHSLEVPITVVMHKYLPINNLHTLMHSRLDELK